MVVSGMIMAAKAAPDPTKRIGTGSWMQTGPEIRGMLDNFAGWAGVS